MNVLPPPTSPRASANGTSELLFNLNVVPPSRLRPALVAEALVPPDGSADACAMFNPPPSYGVKLCRAGTGNRDAPLPLTSLSMLRTPSGHYGQENHTTPSALTAGCVTSG